MKIVLAFFDSNIQVYQRKLNGMQRFAATRRWHIENITVQEQAENIRNLLDFWHPIGCIVEGGDENRMTRAMFGNCPVVYINHKESAADAGASVVQFDGNACAELALEELSLTGCAHYAFVHPTFRHRFWSSVRGDAFVRLCAAKRLPCSVFDPGQKDIRRTEFIRRLRPWLVKLPRSCGVFAANDEVASAVAAACSLEGIQIPKDVSIIGVDNDEMVCRNSTPELSSVRPNFEQGGYLAAELLERAIRFPRRKGSHVLYPPTDVVRRGSTRVFTRKYPEVNTALELIRQKACAGLTAAEALKTFSCSRRLADQRFREVTGRSVLEAIQDVRLAKIQELIAKPRQSLELLAGFCGYESQNSLRKFFKARTGMTLSEWRKKHFGPVTPSPFS